MSDLNIPPAPQPEKKDTVTFNKKNLAIAFLALSLFVLFIVLIIPGDNSSAPKTTNAPAPVVTNPPITAAPVTNKYDDYMNHVLNNSGQANSWSKADVIEFGDLVCAALDKGNSISSVVNLLQGYAKSNSDIEFFASVAFGAITYICPEYKADLDAYLAN